MSSVVLLTISRGSTPSHEQLTLPNTLFNPPPHKCMKTGLISQNDRPAGEISAPQNPQIKIGNDHTVPYLLCLQRNEARSP